MQRFYKASFSMDPWKQLPGGNIPVVGSVARQGGQAVAQAASGVLQGGVGVVAPAGKGLLQADGGMGAAVVSGKKSLADLMEESAMEAEGAEGEGPGDRFTVQAADDRPWH